MSEEESESYQTSVKPFEIEEEFYTGEQPVCVFLYINRHQQDPLKEQGTQISLCGYSPRPLHPLSHSKTFDFLSLLFNSAGAEKQSVGSSSAHACATFMGGVTETETD